MDKNNPTSILLKVLIAALVVGLGVFVLSQSGIFDALPTVETKADNCYDETLYVITDDDYSPYSFYDENGEFSGHDVELIALVANELNMNLDLKFMLWDDAIKATGEGKADVLMTCDYSDTFEGVDTLIKTEPVSTDDFIVYSKTGIKTVDELYEKKCAVMENGNVLAQLKMLNLIGKCQMYPNNRDAMVALEKGEVDCTIVRYTVGEALLKELGFKDISGTISIGQSYMCFGIANNNQELADRINAAIENLKVRGEMDRLQKKWLTSFIHQNTLAEIITNNVWIVIAIILAIIAALLLYLRRQGQLKKADDERNRYIKIIENLANDFECVNYVILKDDKAEDEAVLIRTSDTLIRNIPEWDSETNFLRRMRVLLESLVVPEDRKEFREQTTREVVISKLSEGDAYFVNFRAFIDGESKYYQIKFSNVEGNKAEAISALVFGLHDIDEETKREIADKEALKNALEKEKIVEEKLEIANKSKTDFLFNMSHDIRTPMNAITGFTDLAEKNLGNRDKVEDYLSKIKNSSNHLLELINEVLEMSRVEAGKLTSEMKAVSIKEEADKMMSICKETADMRNIRLSLIVDDIVHDTVYADELHVNRVITNILGNAIKYTMPGGNVIYSVIELEQDVSGYAKYEFIVEDNGIGMSKDFLDKIFESFSREENEAVHDIQGTGLGMSIVKRLVDFMDGTIDISSEQGKGTKVTVILEFKIADKEELKKSEDILDVNLSGRKALLVEDNDLNREIAREILSEQGIIVEEAANGKEAVSEIKNKGADYYDFVLMDIQMPFMNGYEATEAIRQLPGADKLIIIALSANAFAEDRSQSLAAGMNDHIAKPINVKQLFNAISGALK